MEEILANYAGAGLMKDNDEVVQSMEWVVSQVAERYLNTNLRHQMSSATPVDVHIISDTFEDPFNAFENSLQQANHSLLLECESTVYYPVQIGEKETLPHLTVGDSSVSEIERGAELASDKAICDSCGISFGSNVSLSVIDVNAESNVAISDMSVTEHEGTNPISIEALTDNLKGSDEEIEGIENLPSDRSSSPEPPHIIENPRATATSLKSQDPYQKAFDERKRTIEKEAEDRAIKRLCQHEKEGETLEDIINICLKDYSEFHEMAHTVRLKFESEKSKVLTAMQKMMTAQINKPTESIHNPLFTGE